MPLLPLAGQVLLPGLPTAWLVSDPRYCAAISDLLAQPPAQRWLAFPRIAPGWECDDGCAPPLLPIVSAARLVHVHALRDGAYHIVVVGDGRWHLDEQPSARPYRVAQLVRLPDMPLDDATVARVRAAVCRLVHRPAAIDDEIACLLDPEQYSPSLVLDRLAALSLVDPDLRQRYLECGSIDERLQLIGGVDSSCGGLAALN
ncbi:MAG: LON peptidase substrate-binding domain-containing protein [Planctomycetota bacterium]|nr:LON peptidase substrate-binding domain-containing protein [Planctomycetota bacterium]MCX8039938.1 LON peptidase substrate-binding domain-containing protein [Planctomycetota bacterium]MDW8373689.1 LON peptidase substrate-binding domain-containing protein [Planctomycetota bacterium]